MPGFDSPTVGYFWRMCVHEGWLYLGTYDWTVWLPFLHTHEWPQKVLKLLELADLDNIVKRRAGFDLWRTKDGVKWLPVSRNGFSNPCNYGVRTMSSSPYGLFIGAANPFGPTMATKRLSGWQYTSNLRGGLEIWLGSRDFYTNSSYDASTEAEKTPGIVSGKKRNSSTDLCENWIHEYYGGNDFRYCGLWRHATKSPREACENLVKEILSFIPGKKHHLLEIGRSARETSRIILGDPVCGSLTRIVQTKEELEACQKIAPSAIYRIMKPHKLKFKEKSFDYVICIEGPNALGPGKRLFKEVYRILKPGGGLLFSDIIFNADAPSSKIARERNIANTLPKYRELLVRCGFEHVNVLDATRLCWIGFRANYLNEFGLKLLSGEISFDLYRDILKRLPDGGMPVSYYVVGSVTKKTETKEKVLI